jgi:hypothetical protein
MHFSYFNEWEFVSHVEWNVLLTIWSINEVLEYSNFLHFCPNMFKQLTTDEAGIRRSYSSLELEKYVCFGHWCCFMEFLAQDEFLQGSSSEFPFLLDVYKLLCSYLLNIHGACNYLFCERCKINFIFILRLLYFVEAYLEGYKLSLMQVNDLVFLQNKLTVIF